MTVVSNTSKVREAAAAAIRTLSVRLRSNAPGEEDDGADENDLMANEIDVPAKGGAIGWQNVALAFASVLFALIGFLELTFWNRLTQVEAIINARGERLAILEARTAQDRTDIQRIGEALDRFSATLTDMKSDHRQFSLMLDKMRH